MKELHETIRRDSPVESWLNIFVDRLRGETGATKVHNFDGTASRCDEENVFRFQITVNDIQGGLRKEGQSRAQLSRKFASQIEGDPVEIGVA